MWKNNYRDPSSFVSISAYSYFPPKPRFRCWPIRSHVAGRARLSLVCLAVCLFPSLLFNFVVYNILYFVLYFVYFCISFQEHTLNNYFSLKATCMLVCFMFLGVQLKLKFSWVYTKFGSIILLFEDQPTLDLDDQLFLPFKNLV